MGCEGMRAGRLPLRSPQRPRRVTRRLALLGRILTLPTMIGPPHPAGNRCRVRLKMLRGWEEAPMLGMRHLLTAPVLPPAAVILAPCSSSPFNNPLGSNPFSSSAPEAPSTPLPPPSLKAEDIVGRW